MELTIPNFKCDRGEGERVHLHYGNYSRVVGDSHNKILNNNNMLAWYCRIV